MVNDSASRPASSADKKLLAKTRDRVDEELAADPGQAIRPHQIFFSICQDLALDIDLAIVPNEYIGLYDEDPDPDDEDDPRATSPP